MQADRAAGEEDRASALSRVLSREFSRVRSILGFPLSAFALARVVPTRLRMRKYSFSRDSPRPPPPRNSARISARRDTFIDKFIDPSTRVRANPRFLKYKRYATPRVPV